jgi:hypothetical protein
MQSTRIPHRVAERLGHYVYAYVRRSDGRISYIGKGQGQRALAHLWRLRSHQIEILAHSLPDENTAYSVETALIDALKLTNQIRGRHSIEFGRAPLKELVFRYAAKPVNIREPSILIRINQLYRPGMSARQLYEVTRGVWAIGKRRETVKYALAVYHSIVREVYRIKSWHPAGTSSYRYRSRADVHAPGRWEFRGVVAEPGVRNRYVGRSVEHLLPTGSQNPIKYVP